MAVAYPLLVESVDGGSATVSLKGKRMTVDVGMISDLSPGDYVLAHGSLAIQKLSPEQGKVTISMLEQVEEYMGG